jgi:DNA-binding GntR family transcriptional regulator
MSAEHALVLAAVHDADGAEHAMAAHVEGARDRLRSVLESTHAGIQR